MTILVFAAAEAPPCSGLATDATTRHNWTLFIPRRHQQKVAVLLLAEK